MQTFSKKEIDFNVEIDLYAAGHKCFSIIKMVSA